LFQCVQKSRKKSKKKNLTKKRKIDIIPKGRTQKKKQIVSKKKLSIQLVLSAPLRVARGFAQVVQSSKARADASKKGKVELNRGKRSRAEVGAAASCTRTMQLKKKKCKKA
jgi:hypothetical protein